MTSEFEGLKEQQEQIRHKWNEEVRQALTLNDFDKLAELLIKKDDTHSLYESFFNHLINKFANSNWSETYNFALLSGNITSIIDDSIAQSNINLSDNEFKQIMLNGGFANIFKIKDDYLSSDFNSRVWDFKNIEKYLTEKLKNSRSIDTAIDYLFDNSRDIVGSRLLIGCAEILKFSPKDKRQYALNKISEKLTENKYLKTKCLFQDLSESMWVLLEYCNQYNLKPVGSFWHELKDKINKKINKNYNGNEIRLNYHYLKGYFNFLLVKNANIPQLLDIQWNESVMNNFFKIYTKSIQDEIKSIKRDKTNPKINEVNHIYYLFKDVNNIFNTYKNMSSKNVFNENTQKLFLKKVGNMFSPEDIDFIEGFIYQKDLQAKRSSKLLDYLSEIKKIKISFNTLNSFTKANTKNKLKI